MKEKIILTFDLEFWYNSGFLKKYVSENDKRSRDYITQSTMPILDLLKKFNHRATFFVLGQVAEKYPELIKKISDDGHEIASHGYSHKSLFDLDKTTFQKEIELTNNILKNVIGTEPKGFRAPNFSLNKKNLWAKEILENYFQYNSSSHPLKFFAIPMQIPEIFPSLGGIYFRMLPLKLYILMAKFFSKYKVPVLYFHPYELFESAPRINSAPWYMKKIKYIGVKKAWKKFKKIMDKYEFISIQQYLDLK